MISTRLACRDDVPTLYALLQELAAFEGGSLSSTPDDLARDGFGDRPLFQALLAEQDGAVLGMLIFFPIYSSWRGRPGVMIHDLFVTQAARGLGIGKTLVTALAAQCVQQGGSRMDVNVLDWNDRARGFYASLGLRHNQGWLGYRIEDDALRDLAATLKLPGRNI